jgi:hypothetical protein
LSPAGGVSLVGPHLALVGSVSARPPVAKWGRLEDLLPMAPPIQQYLLFAANLRAAFRNEVDRWHSSGTVARGWFKPHDRIAVTPVMGLPPLAKSSALLPNRVLVLIAMFTGCPSFTVSGDTPGVVAGRHMALSLRYPCQRAVRGQPARPGVLLSVTVSGKRRLAVAIGDSIVVDRNHVARDLERDSGLVRGCWGIVRLWHRERRRGISEAPAESWCGQLGALWDPVQGPLTGALVDRLALRVRHSARAGPAVCPCSRR